MKFSYNELQKYIKSSLPPVSELAGELTDKAFEVEQIDSSNGDYLMDVKVLPDRPDCKNQKGLAQEISAILNLPLISELSKISDSDDAREKIPFNLEEINSILGVSLSEEEVVGFLERLRIGVKKDGDTLTAFIPAERVDLNILEDLADEVGRLFGVEKIIPAPLSKTSRAGHPNPTFALSNKVREFLVNKGFSEIYGYTLSPKGEMETEKPLASDKAFLRTNLTDGMREKLQLNLQNIIFDNELVKIFEIGTVFPDSKGTEVSRLAIAVGYKSKKFKADLSEELKKWGGNLSEDESSQILELDLESLKDKVDWQNPADLSSFINLDIKYSPFSVFPRVVRDLAIWVDSETKNSEVEEVIKENAGELLSQRPILFDEFKKDGKISYAFRLIFQSKEQTLTDDEVNKIMEGLEKVVKDRGWEVR